MMLKNKYLYYKYRKIYCRGTYYNCEGHVVVCIGYETDGKGNMTVEYYDPDPNVNGIQKVDISQMKSQLNGTNYNYYGAYSIRENIERSE